VTCIARSSSIPDEIKKHIDLNNGNDRGRIYRIVPDKGAERIGQKINLAHASTEELVKTLSHPNGWHRDTAQRLLVERQDKAAVPLLENVLSADNALARLHALGALEGLNSPRQKSLLSALKDKDDQVVLKALMLVEFFEREPMESELFEQISELCKTQSARLQFQLLCMLPWAVEKSEIANGETENAGRLVNTMLRMAVDGLEDKWRQSAFFGSHPDAARTLLPVCLTFDPELKKAALATMVEMYATTVGKPNSWMPNAPTFPASKFIEWQAANPRACLIKAFASGLKRGGSSMELEDKEGAFKQVILKAAETASSSQTDSSARLDAIELLGVSTSKESLDALIPCLGDKQPESAQTAAIHVLNSNNSGAVTDAMLKNLPHFSPKARTAALETMLSRDDRAEALLAAMNGSAEALTPTDLSASQVQSLVKHKNAQIATLAKTVLASVIPLSRAEVTAKFKPALGMKGNWENGKAQYAGRCMACHVANGEGIAVGPDLVTVKTKGREALLEAILQPHKEVAAQFIAYTVGTKDGQTISGIVTRDEASSMTLKMMGGAEITQQRANIKGSTSNGQSLMPEGLETGMSVQDMADLLDFIEAVN
jgi:putative heme-binding domain-containing protein